MNIFLVCIFIALIVFSGCLYFIVCPSKRSKMPSDEEWELGKKKRGPAREKPDKERKPGHKEPDSLEGLLPFTREELAKATNDFTDKVGEGGSAVVYRANLEGKTVAVKQATKRGIEDPKAFREELWVLRRIRHRNLVSLIGFCFEGGEQFLVFEFVPQGSLYDRLHTERGRANPLPWASRVQVAFQIAEALKYLHEKASPPIVHRDIKSANVLLMDDNHAKLADFGLSILGPKNNESTFSECKGSCGYIDPQYVVTGKVSSKSDVFSFGVLLLELVTGLTSVIDSQALAERGFLELVTSVKDSKTLADWSKRFRESVDPTEIMKIVDSNIKANVDSKEVQSIIEISNLCLTRKRESRPSMSEIVIMMKNAFHIKGTESGGDERDPSHGGAVLGSEAWP